jgi:7-cyano-7-deazaguanine reductase
MDYQPKYLGSRSGEPVDTLDLIPWDGAAISITLTCTEFTSLCPVTRQPDFGEITVVYQPDRHIIETKSMKLYLMQYRNTGVFSECLVDTIADDLWAQVKPRYLAVKGAFKSRGGIQITAEAERPVSGPEGSGKQAAT